MRWDSRVYLPVVTSVSASGRLLVDLLQQIALSVIEELLNGSDPPKRPKHGCRDGCDGCRRPVSGVSATLGPFPGLSRVVTERRTVETDPPWRPTVLASRTVKYGPSVKEGRKVEEMEEMEGSMEVQTEVRFRRK